MADRTSIVRSFATVVAIGLGGLAPAPALPSPLAPAVERPSPAGGGQAAATAPATFNEPLTGMPLVFVKGGCFQMGNVFGDAVDIQVTDEDPVHEVCVGDFYLGKFEVTQGEWKAVMGFNPVEAAVPSANCVAADCPVDRVTREQVQAFLDKLNAKAGRRAYRLPTEAEWEYAARSGGKAERFAGGQDSESVAWNMATSGFYTHPLKEAPWARPVGQRAPNGLGLYDMTGNVYEFVSDRYDPTYYARSPRVDPQGPESGEFGVKRGGCAHGESANGRTMRRSQDTGWDDLLGFRVLKVP